MYHGKGGGNCPVLVVLLAVGLLSTVQVEMASIIRQSGAPVGTGQQNTHLRRPRIRLRIPLRTTALPTPTLRRDPAQTRALLRPVHPLLMISPLPLTVLHPHLRPKGSQLSQRT